MRPLATRLLSLTSYSSGVKTGFTSMPGFFCSKALSIFSMAAFSNVEPQYMNCSSVEPAAPVPPPPEPQAAPAAPSAARPPILNRSLLFMGVFLTQARFRRGASRPA
ncbi:hypothetical protein ACFQ0B_45945 [Nonomuraea thailandensis]